MHPWRRRTLILTLSLSMLTACQSIGTNVDEALLPTLHEGEVSYYEVVAKLGKPNRSELRADGTRQITYSYTQTQPNWQSFVWGLAAFQGAHTAETSEVVFEFDKDGRLLTKASSHQQTTVGTGIFSGARQ